METSDVAVNLLIGTLFVYGVGIAVPTLIRFVFYKKPLSKGATIGLLVVWWFVLFTSIYFLKGENKPNEIPIIIVLLISYGILMSGSKKDKPAQISDDDANKLIQG